MVSRTHEDDEMPSHDSLGTDLRRVAEMRDAGYSERLIAAALGTTVGHIRYAVMVLTGDRDGCPTPEEIEAQCLWLQTGWTEDMAVAAKHRLPRNSSILLRPGYEATCQKRRDTRAAQTAERVAAGIVRVFPRSNGGWNARPAVSVNGVRYQAQQAFDTREEAEAWGREWLRRTYEQAQAGACVGK